MPELPKPRVAIIDFAMGNLFSIQNACAVVGLEAHITCDQEELLSADGVILPGVGAFGKAMDTLRQLDLVDTIKEVVHREKPFMGICLGMQLLMSKSHEFGQHAGLDILKGSVIRFENDKEEDPAERLKVPHVGWSQVDQPKPGLWKETVLSDLNDRDFMYFVHSFYVQPEDPDVILSLTRYGRTEFCSSLQYKNVFACQFHPEKSAGKGLQIYKNWAIRNWGISTNLYKEKEFKNVDEQITTRGA